LEKETNLLWLLRRELGGALFAMETMKNDRRSRKLSTVCWLRSSHRNAFFVSCAIVLPSENSSQAADVSKGKAHVRVNSSHKRLLPCC